MEHDTPETVGFEEPGVPETPASGLPADAPPQTDRSEQTPSSAHQASPPRRSGPIIAGALVVALFAGAGGGVAAYLLAPTLLPDAAPAEQRITIEATGDEPVTAAAAVAMPSVVNIDVSGVEAAAESDLPEEHPDVPSAASGSGVAYRAAEGGGTYIVTNDHVITDADEIVVTDYRGDRYDAEIVGSDPETDIGVIRVDADIAPIELGDSEEIEVGQLVVVIGSPFGLELSVSSGVVSAMHRSLPDSLGAENKYPLVDVVQTDASINPGNSGGAMVDREGKLIGIPAAIFSNTGAADGVGFAVPVRTASRVADEIIETGSARHPFLGIVGQTVTPLFAEEEGLPVEEGAYVVEITPGTEAEKAELRTGDIIVSLDGERIRGMDDLILEVRRRRVGDTVTLELYRDGELIEVEMGVGVKPADL